MRRFTAAVLAFALCLTACTNTKSILYRASMFGNMTAAGVMLGDDGRTYHFSNDADFPELPQEGRIVAILDALDKQEGSGEHYDAELLNYSVPLCKEPVTCSTEEEVAALGDDPIKMEDGSWSGSYLNMICTVMLKSNSTAKHMVNLQIVPGASTDTLHAVLRHNAFADKIDEAEADLFEKYPFYASFPLADKLPEGKATVLELKWYWEGEWHTMCSSISR